MTENANSGEALSYDTDSKTIGNYILGKTIGEGTFGKVKLGTHTLTGEKVAIKILEKNRILEVADIERIQREIHILKLIRHPNIIQLYEIIETAQQLFLIMEYASGGELFEYIVENNRINEKEACKYLQQIIAGVEYLHKLRVVHRDLKPENLLMDHNKNIKIVDFGLSNTYKEGELLKTACGSPCYAAPEMVAGKKYVPIRVDVWSCGIILYALICGYLPFEDPDTGKLYKKIINGDFTIPKFISPDAKDLLKCILHVDANKRYTINDIRNHRWFKNAKLEKNPEGIIIGMDPIPIEPVVLNQMESYGFEPEAVRKQLENNKHNDITTTYYLLHQRFIKNGGKVSISLSSNAEKSSKDSVISQIESTSNPQESLGAINNIKSQIVEKEKPRNPQPKRESTGGSSSMEQDMTITKTNAVIDDTSTNTKDIRQKSSGSRPAALVNNFVDPSLPSQTHTATPVTTTNSELVQKAQKTALDAGKQVQPRKKRAPKQSESPDTHRRKQLASPSDRVRKPRDASSSQSKEPVSKKSKDNCISPSVHTQHISHNEPSEQNASKKPGKKKLKIPTDSAQPTTNDQIITRSMVSTPQETTATTRSKVIPHNERIHTEGHIQLGTRESALLEFLDCDPTLRNKVRLVSPANRTKNVQNRSNFSPVPQPNSVRTEHATQSSVNQKRLPSPTGTTSPMRFETRGPEKQSRERVFNAANVLKATLVSPRSKVASPRPRVGNQTEIIMIHHTATPSGSHTAGTQNSSANNSNVSSILATKAEKPLDQKPKEERPASPSGSLKVHKGPFHFNSVSSKTPKNIMSEICRAVDGLRIFSKTINKYCLRCERDAVKFEVEVNSIHNFESLYLVKFTKLSGDTARYNEISSMMFKIIGI